MNDRWRTFGDGDPRLSPSLATRHEEAKRRGEPLYLDPHSGLWVQTSATLAENGECCGRGCRHCPYDRAEQERAGRTVLRPEERAARSDGRGPDDGD